MQKIFLSNFKKSSEFVENFNEILEINNLKIFEHFCRELEILNSTLCTQLFEIPSIIRIVQRNSRKTKKKGKISAQIEKFREGLMETISSQKYPQ